jgi:hypothetical protein
VLLALTAEQVGVVFGDLGAVAGAAALLPASESTSALVLS